MYVVDDGSLAVFVLLQREMTLGSPLLIPMYILNCGVAWGWFIKLTYSLY